MEVLCMFLVFGEDDRATKNCLWWLPWRSATRRSNYGGQRIFVGGRSGSTRRSATYTIFPDSSACTTYCSWSHQDKAHCSSKNTCRTWYSADKTFRNFEIFAPKLASHQWANLEGLCLSHKLSKTSYRKDCWFVTCKGETVCHGALKYVVISSCQLKKSKLSLV